MTLMFIDVCLTGRDKSTCANHFTILNSLKIYFDILVLELFKLLWQTLISKIHVHSEAKSHVHSVIRDYIARGQASALILNMFHLK